MNKTLGISNQKAKKTASEVTQLKARGVSTVPRALGQPSPVHQQTHTESRLRMERWTVISGG